MKIKVTLVCILIVVGSISNLGSAVQDKIMEDLVQLIDGKMVIEEYGLYKIEIKGYKPFSSQIKFHAEAVDTGFISRDYFVSAYAYMQTYFLQIMFAQSYNVKISTFLKGTDYEELDEPIGNVDFEINMYMNKLGMQVEVINGSNNTVERHTMTWEEMDK